jgi:hypothetical protein
MGRGFEESKNDQYYQRLVVGTMKACGFSSLVLATPGIDLNHESLNTFCENSYSFGEHSLGMCIIFL